MPRCSIICSIGVLRACEIVEALIVMLPSVSAGDVAQPSDLGGSRAPPCNRGLLDPVIPISLLPPEADYETVMPGRDYAGPAASTEHSARWVDASLTRACIGNRTPDGAPLCEASCLIRRRCPRQSCLEGKATIHLARANNLCRAGPTTLVFFLPRCQGADVISLCNIGHLTLLLQLSPCNSWTFSAGYSGGRATLL